MRNAAANCRKPSVGECLWFEWVHRDPFLHV
jgi:hypothetical protein